MGLAVARAGAQRVGSGVETTPRCDDFGALIAAGQRRQDLLDGNLFIYHVASQALILTATTGNSPTVFNPLGSGVVFIPIALKISWISGTTVIGSVVICETLNAGSSQATAGAILTFTKVAAENALRGSGKSSRVFWSPSVSTYTAAPTARYATGINLAPADPVSGFNAFCEFNDHLAYMPGTAMSVCYSVTTSTALFQITLIGAELPLPPGF